MEKIVDTNIPQYDWNDSTGPLNTYNLCLINRKEEQPISQSDAFSGKIHRRLDLFLFCLSMLGFLFIFPELGSVIRWLLWCHYPSKKGGGEDDLLVPLIGRSI